MGNPVCRKFLQNVHGQWFPDNVTQLCNELVNPYSPLSPSSTVTALCLLSYRPRASSIVPLTLKLLKRSHSRPCSFQHRFQPACCLRNTFDVLRNVSPPVAYIVAPRVQLGSSLKECYLSRCEVTLALLLMKWISTEFYDIVIKISNILGSKKFPLIQRFLTRLILQNLKIIILLKLLRWQTQLRVKERWIGIKWTMWERKKEKKKRGGSRGLASCNTCRS